MNILIDGLPDDYHGIKLNTDYKNWMQFELILQDRSISDVEKGTKVIELTISDLHLLEQVDEKLIDYLLWFYSCGKEEIKSNEEEAEEESDFKKKNKRIYSFDYDSDYIYAAFLECYGIDLTSTDMHWWKFKSLFKALNDDCMFSKILGYRSITISSKMSKDEQKHYLEMKKIYALPDLRSEEEKESDFANTLFASM